MSTLHIALLIGIPIAALLATGLVLEHVIEAYERSKRGLSSGDGETVSPDEVRSLLTSRGELTINPRRLSAFYNRAVSQGLLEFSHWGINGDHKGRNAGRPARVYRLVAA